MKTYQITVWYDNDSHWSQVAFELDFSEERSMQHYVEKLAVVGVWEQGESVLEAILIPANLIRRINVVVVDE